MKRVAIKLTLVAVAFTVLAVPAPGNAVLNFKAGCGIEPATAVGSSGGASILRTCTFKVPGPQTDGSPPVGAGVFGFVEARTPFCFFGFCTTVASGQGVWMHVWLRRVSTGDLLVKCWREFSATATCLIAKPVQLWPGETLRCEVHGSTMARAVRITGACFM